MYEKEYENSDDEKKEKEKDINTKGKVQDNND